LDRPLLWAIRISGTGADADADSGVHRVPGDLAENEFALDDAVVETLF